MIPLRISLEGFLSYREKQIFSFADAPLWVLSGPNGAGKSAVFDAITFALYGRHRGKGKTHKSLIHHNASSLEVEFDFIFDRQIYRVRRTVSNARHGRSTFGAFRLTPSEEDGEWFVDPIENTDSERGLETWAENLLGLHYDAFVSSLLLLQGHSEKLLDGDPKDRAETLKQLVGLVDYERLYQMADARRRHYEDKHKIIFQQLNGIPAVSAEEMLAAQQIVATTEEEWKVAQTRTDHLQSLFIQAKQWEQLIAEVSQQQAIIQEARLLLEREKEIETRYDRLRQLETALPTLNQVIINRGHLDDCMQQQAQLKQQIAQASTELAIAQEEQRGAEAEAERIENKVSELQNRHADVAKRIEESLPLLHKLEQWEQAQAECEELTRQLACLPSDLPQLLATAKVRARQLAEVEQALPWLERFAEYRAELADAQGSIEHASEQFAQLETRLREQNERCETLSQELQAVQQRERACALEMTTARTIFTQNNERRERFMMAAQQAACDYCGQTISEEHKHGQLARLAEDISASEAQAQSAETRHQQAVAELSQFEADYAEQSQHRARLNDQHRKGQAELLELQSEYNGYLTKLEMAFFQLPLACQQLIHVLPVDNKVDWLCTSYPTAADLQQWRQEAAQGGEHQQYLQTLNEQHQQWQSLRTLLQAAQEREKSFQLNGQFEHAQSARAEKTHLEQQRSELDKLRRQYEATRDSARQRVKQLGTQVEVRQREVHQLEANAQSTQARATELANQLRAAVNMLPHEWQPQADNWREDDLRQAQAEREELADYAGLYRELERARQALAHSEQRLHELRDKLAGLSPAAQRPSREVETELRDARQQRDLADAKRQQSQADCSKLEEQRQTRERLEKEFNEAERLGSLYKLLAGLLGREGLQLRLLRRAERAIVNYANEILAGLSRGQLRLALRGEEADGGQASISGEKALDLEVYNQEISAKPIPVFQTSGSQRFRLAVSLALAIGRYASEDGRALESVIIDEGFGSLDQNGRDDMIQELHRLQQQLAKILIVSHQEDFARAFGNGYSVRLIDGATQVGILTQS